MRKKDFDIAFGDIQGYRYMRMLTYKIDQYIIDHLKYNNRYIIDEIHESHDLVYHLEIRFYNLVLIYENNPEDCANFLQITSNINTAFVIVTDNVCSKFELNCLKKGAIDVIKESIYKDLIIARIETIHRENFSDNLTFKDLLFFNNEYKIIFDKDKNELDISGKSFDIFKYLVQNNHRRIPKNELIQVFWDDPEMINSNLIEVYISNLRAELKKHLNIELIDTIRNKGYKIKTL